MKLSTYSFNLRVTYSSFTSFKALFSYFFQYCKIKTISQKDYKVQLMAT